MANPILSSDSNNNLLIANEETGSKDIKIEVLVPGETVVAEDGNDSQVPGPTGNTPVFVFARGVRNASAPPAIPDTAVFDKDNTNTPFSGSEPYAAQWTQLYLGRTDTEDVYISEAEYDKNTQQVVGSWSPPKIFSGPPGKDGVTTTVTETVHTIETSPPIIVPASKGDVGPQAPERIPVYFVQAKSITQAPAKPTATGYNPRLEPRGQFANLSPNWYVTRAEAQNATTNFSNANHTVWQSETRYDFANESLGEFSVPIPAALAGTPGNDGSFWLLYYQTVAMRAAAPTTPTVASLSWTSSGGLTGLPTEWVTELTNYDADEDDLYLLWIEIAPSRVQPIKTVQDTYRINARPIPAEPAQPGRDAVQPSITVPIFRRVDIGTTVTKPTVGNYNLSNNTIGSLPSGWHLLSSDAIGVNFNPGLHELYLVIIRFNPDGTPLDTSEPTLLSGVQGLPGSTPILVYRVVTKSTTSLSAPSNQNVTYNPNTDSLVNLSSNWSRNIPSYDTVTHNLWISTTRTIPRAETTHTVRAFATPRNISPGNGSTIGGYTNYQSSSTTSIQTLSSAHIGRLINVDINSSTQRTYRLPRANTTGLTNGSSITFITDRTVSSHSGRLNIERANGSSDTIRIMKDDGATTNYSEIFLDNNTRTQAANSINGVGITLTRASSTSWVAHSVVQDVNPVALQNNTSEWDISKIPQLTTDKLPATIPEANLPDDVGRTGLTQRAAINTVGPHTAEVDSIYWIQALVEPVVFTMPNVSNQGHRIVIRRRIGGNVGGNATINITLNGSSGNTINGGTTYGTELGDQDYIILETDPSGNWNVVINTFLFARWKFEQAALINNPARFGIGKMPVRVHHYNVPVFAGNDIQGTTRLAAYDQRLANNANGNVRTIQVQDLDSRMRANSAWALISSRIHNSFRIGGGTSNAQVQRWFVETANLSTWHNNDIVHFFFSTQNGDEYAGSFRVVDIKAQPDLPNTTRQGFGGTIPRTTVNNVPSDALRDDSRYVSTIVGRFSREVNFNTVIVGGSGSSRQDPNDGGAAGGQSDNPTGSGVTGQQGLPDTHDEERRIAEQTITTTQNIIDDPNTPEETKNLARNIQNQAREILRLLDAEAARINNPNDPTNTGLNAGEDDSDPTQATGNITVSPININSIDLVKLNTTADGRFCWSINTPTNVPSETYNLTIKVYRERKA